MFQPPLILQSSLTVVMLCFSTQLARLPSRSSDRERGEPWYFSLFHTSPVSGGEGEGPHLPPHLSAARPAEIALV